MKKLLLFIALTMFSFLLYAQNNNTLSADFKNVRMVSTENDTLIFNDLLSKHQNRLIVVDFWASWCKPCLEQMPHAATLKQELADAPVSFFYISSDVNHQSWQRMDKKFSPGKTSYRIIAEDKAIIGSELKIKGIPYYLVLDKKHQILEKNAPWPSSKALKKLLERNI